MPTAWSTPPVSARLIALPSVAESFWFWASAELGGHGERGVELLDRLRVLVLCLQRAADGDGGTHLVIRPRGLGELGVLLLGRIVFFGRHQEVAHRLHRIQIVEILRIGANKVVELPAGVADLAVAGEGQLGSTKRLVKLDVLLDEVALRRLRRRSCSVPSDAFSYAPFEVLSRACDSSEGSSANWMLLISLTATVAVAAQPLVDA